MPDYTFIHKRGYVEFYIDGEFAGIFDSREEAMAEISRADEELNDEV